MEDGEDPGDVDKQDAPYSSLIQDALTTLDAPGKTQTSPYSRHVDKTV